MRLPEEEERVDERKRAGEPRSVSCGILVLGLGRDIGGVVTHTATTPRSPPTPGPSALHPRTTCACSSSAPSLSASALGNGGAPVVRRGPMARLSRGLWACGDPSSVDDVSSLLGYLVLHTNNLDSTSVVDLQFAYSYKDIYLRRDGHLNPRRRLPNLVRERRTASRAPRSLPRATSGRLSGRFLVRCLPHWDAMVPRRPLSLYLRQAGTRA